MQQRCTLIIGSVICAALAAQIAYAQLMVAPFWGDVYHHWLISRLTLENNWVYSDYKELTTLWLPVYHYLVTGIMAITGRSDLASAQPLNALFAIASSGTVAWLAGRQTNNPRAALLGGLTLIGLPWSLAYSQLNMPETWAGLLLLLIVGAVWQNAYRWLPLLALLGTLTRHELTLLIGVIVAWQLWQRQWHSALRLASGSIVGLIGWSWWSWHLTGDLLAWFTQYQAATAWDAQFALAAGFRPQLTLTTFHQLLQQAFPPLPIAAFALAIGLTYAEWRRQIGPLGRLLLLLVGAHWLAVALILSQNLPSLDPRYLLMTMPLAAAAGSIAIARVPRRPTRWLLGMLQLIWVVGATVTQLPHFADKNYGLTPELMAGQAIATLATDDGMLWVDSPAAIYASGLPLTRFVSSERLQAHTGISAEQIAQHNIDLILWQPVSYNFVPNRWPQMDAGRPFTADGLHFEPLFVYEGWELQYGAKQTIVWRVK